jgi:hypothetical protein
VDNVGEDQQVMVPARLILAHFREELEARFLGRDAAAGQGSRLRPGTDQKPRRYLRGP